MKKTLTIFDYFLAAVPAGILTLIFVQGNFIKEKDYFIYLGIFFVSQLILLFRIQRKIFNK